MTTALPESWDFAVTRGLIALCEADGLVNYLPAFPAGYAGVAAVLEARPDSPDRLTSWTPYPVTQDGASPMDRLGVQVWMRYAGTNPRPVRDLAEAIRDTLDGLGPLTLSTGVSMSLCVRSSGSSLGKDPAGRWAYVENYYVDAYHPSTHRED